MPVIDIDVVKVRYSNPLKLFQDLRAMGETYCLNSPPAPLKRRDLFRALEIFAGNGGEETFSIAYLTGWAPAPDQQNRSLQEAQNSR